MAAHRSCRFLNLYSGSRSESMYMSIISIWDDIHRFKMFENISSLAPSNQSDFHNTHLSIFIGDGNNIPMIVTIGKFGGEYRRCWIVISVEQ